MANRFWHFTVGSSTQQCISKRWLSFAVSSLPGFAHGCYQLAAIRNNVLASGCCRFAVYLLPDLCQWRCQFAFLRIHVLATGYWQFAVYSLLGPSGWVLSTGSSTQQCIHMWGLSMCGSFATFISENGCYQFAGVRSNVLANGCLTSICSCPQLYIYKWLLSICGLFATIVLANGCYQFAVSAAMY